MEKAYSNEAFDPNFHPNMSKNNGPRLETLGAFSSNFEFDLGKKRRGKDCRINDSITAVMDNLTSAYTAPFSHPLGHIQARTHTETHVRR